MLTRLGHYADKALELGWLAAAVLVPTFFNVYSSRVFEPDKIALLRSIVLLMLVAWLVKLLEGGWRAMQASPAATRAGRAAAALQGAAEGGLPSWLGFLRVPMVVPVLVYALAYLISTIFTVTPDATIFGSYQRLQGTYTQYSYMLLGIMVIANMRTRRQLERLVTFIILASVPVALYGILQAARMDPLPWAGDTATRVASSMGNAIFVAAWLIIAAPFTLYRFLVSVNASVEAGRKAEVSPAAGDGDVRRRPTRRSHVAYEGPDYGWAVVANSVGILVAALLLFFFVLKLIANLPLPDAQLWPSLPVALLIFLGGCFAIDWMSSHRDEPAVGGVILWAVAMLVFLSALLAFVPQWKIGANNVGIDLTFDGLGFLWVFFFTLAWGAIAATAYALGGPNVEPNPRSDIIRTALNVGYGLLLIVQVLCIYLTQSRGPWLGIGVGMVVFALGLWFVGRERDVLWMRRIGTITSGIVLAGALFVGLLNIPGSPLQSLDGLPVVGRGVERLSTLFRTEDGTGKVRTLIWLGATQLIASDPVRAVIGYGPEAMYVVYNKFYPAELAHWELRNATPDRSHNVEFDHMVTMGAMGLIAYYFIVGAFFFYGVRLTKRALGTRDQLLAITLISAVAAHFIEIQTGIQIASTWTYFYLLIGMLVVFGYFITGHLREQAAPVAQDAPARGDAGAAVAQTSVVASESRRPLAASTTATSATRTAAAKVVPATGGNGKPSAPAPGMARKGGAPAGQGQGQRQGQGQGQGGHSSAAQADARRRQDQARARSGRGSAPVPAPGITGGELMRNPLMLVAYAAALGLAIYVIFSVNVATVQADTLYKQGQAYDQANRWPDSVTRYQRAIALQPNQDYYYLFLGRAYLEWAKQTDQDLSGKDPSTGQNYTQQAIAAERTARLQAAQTELLRARELNPLNTDHYANLGRLYLFWSDPTGGNDLSKRQLAVDYMKKATENSPGNAQIWDELAIAYARNNQFAEAMSTADYSFQKVDNTYARTPFIKGQLLQERAINIKNALIANTALPGGGETDYGKVVLAAGQAFSESIALDPASFVDNGMAGDGQNPGRVDFFLSAGQPFTNSNSTVPQAQLQNVLTDTISAAFKNLEPVYEKALADFVRARGVQFEGNRVPDSVLQNLWKNTAWTGIRPTGSTPQWTDLDMFTLAGKAVVPYAAEGYIQFKLNNLQGAMDNYGRAVDIDPSNYFNQKNLGSLLSEQKRCSEAITHLQAALQILQSDPELNTNSNKRSDYQTIQQEVQRVQQTCQP